MTKSKMALVTFITLILIISVGFASWKLILPISGDLDTDASVIVYETADECKYLTIKDDSTSFDYYNTGFVEDDAIITKTGNITVNFSLNMALLNADFDTDNLFKGKEGISITVTLKYSEVLEKAPQYNIFGNSNTPINCSVEGDNLHGMMIDENSIINDETGYTLVLLLNDVNNITDTTIDFTITYEVNLGEDLESPHAYFKEEVFPYLQDMKFAIRAKVEGK